MSIGPADELACLATTDLACLAICIYRGKYAGETKVVLRPKTVEEVSKLMAYCAKNSIAITPQGGNTGLVGGSVPVYDEVIITLVSFLAAHRVPFSS